VDAPLYKPSRAFERPVVIAQPLNADTTPLAVLLAEPDARAILAREAPVVEQAVQGDALRPHLSNFSLRSLLPFGLITLDTLQRMDTQLQALRQRPGQRP